jgi:hypothetical protein
LLGTFTVDGLGGGLSFGEPADGVVGNELSESWEMTALETGIAGWFRLRTADDDFLTSDVLPRVDGSVSAIAGNGDLVLYQTAFVEDETYTLESFRMVLAAN